MNPKYAVGERVIIVAHSDEYKGKYNSECGEVISTYHRDSKFIYGIKLDNYTNKQSSKGLYWFSVKSIKLENEREEIPMFKNYTTVEVAFLDNPAPTYPYALYDSEVKVNDIVVVNTGHHGFALAKVVLFPDGEHKREVQFNREVVCRVDFSQFEARKEAVKRATELKREMEKRMREAQEIALYEMLAEKDQTLKGMLEEYKTLMESCK